MNRQLFFVWLCSFFVWLCSSQKGRQGVIGVGPGDQLSKPGEWYVFIATGAISPGAPGH